MTKELLKIKNAAGFTLIELALVLLIVGLLLTGLLAPLTTLIEQKRRSEMTAQFKDIENALLGFAMVSDNNRLPCPDCLDTGGTCVATDNIGDGKEDIIAGQQNNSCKAPTSTNGIVYGGLPWASLGLPPTDPWGRILRYAVVHNIADKIGPKIDPLDPLAPPCGDGKKTFGLCSILDDSTIVLVDDCNTKDNLIRDIPAIVYSQGAHYSNDINAAAPDTLSCHERENLDNDEFFVSRSYSEDYDDMLFWLSPYILVKHMVDAGILP